MLFQSSDDDSLSPPNLKATIRHESAQTTPISPLPIAIQPDPVVSDLASWSIQQALNNDRIYRNAGYADRNLRIYRMVSNQDIEDINELFTL